MKYSFYLAYPNKDISPIMVAIRSNGKRITVTTGISICPANWDAEKKSITKAEPDHKDKNGLLKAFDAKVQKTIAAANYASLDIDYVKAQLAVRKSSKPAKETRITDALAFYKYWAHNSFGNHTANRATTLSYRIFEEFTQGVRVKFDAINYSFYIDYLQWLKDIKQYKPNMQGQAIKCLKAMMNEAYKRELHDNRAFTTFEKPREDVDNVYLSTEEIDRLYHLPLFGFQAMARDLFLVGCYTAMRFSDYSQLTQWDIQGDYITKRQSKTQNMVTIPAHPRVIEIIHRYGGKVPKMDINSLNRTIKTICQLAGLNKRVAITSNRQTRYVEKWTLVSSHTARRSAATNMYLAGIPTLSIMRVTGHKTEKVFMKYIKISDLENAKLIADNSFFK